MMEHSKWLYIRFPRRINDELEVKNIHKEIVSVKMPRQKGRFCYIEFESEDIAQKVREELHGQKFEKGKLYLYKKRTGPRKH